MVNIASYGFPFSPCSCETNSITFSSHFIEVQGSYWDFTKLIFLATLLNVVPSKHFSSSKTQTHIYIIKIFEKWTFDLLNILGPCKGADFRLRVIEQHGDFPGWEQRNSSIYAFKMLMSTQKKTWIRMFAAVLLHREASPPHNRALGASWVTGTQAQEPGQLGVYRFVSLDIFVFCV
jgi:hypothetical protein